MRPKIRKQFEDLQKDLNGLRETAATKEAVKEAKSLASRAHDAAQSAAGDAERVRSESALALDAAEAKLRNDLGDLREQVGRHHEALNALAAVGQEAAAAPSGDQPADPPADVPAAVPIRRARKTS